MIDYNLPECGEKYRAQKENQSNLQKMLKEQIYAANKHPNHEQDNNNDNHDITKRKPRLFQHKSW